LLPSWVIPHPIPPHRQRIERARAAEAILRELDLDIIHDMGFGWYGNILQPHGGSRTAAEERNLMLAPKWMHPIKRVVDRFLPRYREFAELTRRQFGSPDGPVVLALSQMVYRDMQRLHGLPDSRLRLIYNGVDVQRFSPEWRVEHRESTRRRLGIADDEVLFLIVAHNLKLKGVPTLIRSLGQLRRDGVRAKVVVVGGKRTRTMRRLARWQSVENEATFVGAVDDPRDFYAAADVYVQPTFYDPCSLVVLEALACGLPVITTKFNGAGELMTVGEHGFVLDDPADAVGLAKLMQQTLDPERRAAMSFAARQLALQHTFEENVRQIVSVYQELAKERCKS
jgi:UDP-glucose:(heptosyl)LPS alpha-1,3-glucosyltransferase